LDAATLAQHRKTNQSGKKKAATAQSAHGNLLWVLSPLTRRVGAISGSGESHEQYLVIRQNNSTHKPTKNAIFAGL
jgi:hypothetical protein